jgi:hypothetical protein
VDDAFTARHVRYRAVPRTNRTPATSSRAYQSKSARVERAGIVMQSSAKGVSVPREMVPFSRLYPHTRQTNRRWRQKRGSDQPTLVELAENEPVTLGVRVARKA